jgi:leukotriene-A4 hydrolase
LCLYRRYVCIFIGNLVTNENWEHFWLNEGFTSFIEAKLLGNLEKTNGKEVRRFHAAQQWEDLKTAVNTWGLTHPYTCLVYRLHNIDPDDAYSSGRLKIFLENNSSILFCCSTIL